MTTQSNAAKLAAVFGVDAKTVTATRTKTKVVYTDGNTKLEFAIEAGDTSVPGTYDVSITSPTEFVEVLRKPAVAEAAPAPKAATTTGRNSPAGPAFGTRMPR